MVATIGTGVEIGGGAGDRRGLAMHRARKAEKVRCGQARSYKFRTCRRGLAREEARNIHMA